MDDKTPDGKSTGAPAPAGPLTGTDAGELTMDGRAHAPPFRAGISEPSDSRGTLRKLYPHEER